MSLYKRETYTADDFHEGDLVGAPRISEKGPRLAIIGKTHDASGGRRAVNVIFVADGKNANIGTEERKLQKPTVLRRFLHAISFGR